MLVSVKCIPHAQALRAATTHRHDFLNAYVGELGQVIDMDVIRAAKVRMGVDPLGGAGVHYWRPIAERYRLDLTVIRETVVSSRLIDRLTARLGRRLVEVPVGFKWFAAGLQSGALGFCGEESAGATFLRRDGSVWTTDKDGIAAALLAAEITARTGHQPGHHPDHHPGRDPGARYAALAAEFGSPVARRVQAGATARQKQQLTALTPRQISSTTLAVERIESILSHAPGNGEAIGGIKVNTANGWFAARPSGTEDLYKIYAESFTSPAHLQHILTQAQVIVDAAVSPERP